MNKLKIFSLRSLFFLVLWFANTASATIYSYDISADIYRYDGTWVSEPLIFGTALIDDSVTIANDRDGVTPLFYYYNFTYQIELDGYNFDGTGFFSFQNMHGDPYIFGDSNQWDDFGYNDSAFMYTDWETPKNPFKFQLPDEMWGWELDYDFGHYSIGQVRVTRTSEIYVPEPSSLALVCLGLVGVGFSRRMKI